MFFLNKSCSFAEYVTLQLGYRIGLFSTILKGSVLFFCTSVILMLSAVMLTRTWPSRSRTGPRTWLSRPSTRPRTWPSRPRTGPRTWLSRPSTRPRTWPSRPKTGPRTQGQGQDQGLKLQGQGQDQGSNLKAKDRTKDLTPKAKDRTRDWNLVLKDNQGPKPRTTSLVISKKMRLKFLYAAAYTHSTTSTGMYKIVQRLILHHKTNKNWKKIIKKTLNSNKNVGTGTARHLSFKSRSAFATAPAHWSMA